MQLPMLSWWSIWQLVLFVKWNGSKWIQESAPWSNLDDFDGDDIFHCFSQESGVVACECLWKSFNNACCVAEMSCCSACVSISIASCNVSKSNCTAVFFHFILPFPSILNNCSSQLWLVLNFNDKRHNKTQFKSFRDWFNKNNWRRSTMNSHYLVSGALLFSIWHKFIS